VPQSQQASAYDDGPLPIGSQQTISQPYMVARMTELLSLTPASRVLEIGTGSGYQAAILAELAGQVWTLERHPELARRAEALLAQQGYANVHVICADGTLGLAEEAPYDAIIVTAAAPRIPAPLREQLADGGRMVIPVTAGYSQDLLLIEKLTPASRTQEHTDESPPTALWRETTVLRCVFVPLVGAEGYKE